MEENEKNKSRQMQPEDSQRPSLKERFNSWADPLLNRQVSDGSKFSWGLVLLIAVGLYALYKLISSILYFFG